jgi:excisionase family DNA binding protein
MAVGMAMAQQMMNQPGGVMGQATKGIESPVAPTGADAKLEIMSPAQVAQMLGVAESDVIASLEAGDLKGRKIGTQWRVPKAAVDAFLAT